MVHSLKCLEERLETSAEFYNGAWQEGSRFKSPGSQRSSYLQVLRKVVEEARLGTSEWVVVCATVDGIKELTPCPPPPSSIQNLSGRRWMNIYVTMLVFYVRYNLNARET